jgi:hypothetical protein
MSLMTLSVSSLLLVMAFWSWPLLAIDVLVRPPLREEVFSPSQTFQLVIATADQWKSQQSLASFYRLEGGAFQLLWQQTLPHHYRPRFLVVSDAGRVALLDEWINIKTKYAVMILNRHGGLVAHYDFEAISRLLGITGADLVTQAKYGAWLTTIPHLDPTGEAVLAGAGDRQLTIHLDTGQISMAR